jgi:hypothetical protein
VRCGARAWLGLCYAMTFGDTAGIVSPHFRVPSAAPRSGTENWQGSRCIAHHLMPMNLVGERPVLVLEAYVVVAGVDRSGSPAVQCTLVARADPTVARSAIPIERLCRAARYAELGMNVAGECASSCA